MERFLDAYIERMRPYFTGFSGAAAHEIASSFLAFRFGLYDNAVRECTHAISLIPAGEASATLKKALEIIRANAQDLGSSVVTRDPGIVFSGTDLQFVPINLPADKVEDIKTFSLDNALILTWIAALLTSPEDREAMGEHRRLIVRMLAGYKKALGLE